MTEATRPAEAILSRTVRITLGRREWVLPVLTIAGNRRWKAQLDLHLGSVLTGLRKAGTRSPALLQVLTGQIDEMLELLRAYDTTGVLPADLEEIAYEDELIVAVQEVWRAANPLAAIAIEELRRTSGQPMSDGSLPTSSRPPSGAGSPARSTSN